MTFSILFSNDCSDIINFPAHEFSTIMSNRPNKEVLFRKISSLILKNDKMTGNIVDLGAWIGDNSIPWAYNNKGKIVYAIDPSDDNIDYINRVCEINTIKNLKTIKTAVSDKEETLFTTNVDIKHCSFVYNDSQSTNKIEVQSTTLDKLYADGEIDGVEYIHLDAEGMEHRILLGSQKLIEDCKPIIAFEQHFEIDDTKSTVEFLESRGYKVYVINEVLDGCRSDCRNCIATPGRFWFLKRDIFAAFGDNSIISIFSHDL